MNPEYRYSPFGSWLAVPNRSGNSLFSAWFRENTLRNRKITSTLTLLGSGTKDSLNNQSVFTYSSSEYWPLNGKGFEAEGQKDCFTGGLQNRG